MVEYTVHLASVVLRWMSIRRYTALLRVLPNGNRGHRDESLMLETI